MDYYLKMGYITNDEYYSKLEKMRDKYLERDTDEWRSVNVEIKKYYDSLTEEQKKAYEQQLKQHRTPREFLYYPRYCQRPFYRSRSRAPRLADISAKYYQSEVDNLKNNFVDRLREELFGLEGDMLNIGAEAREQSPLSFQTFC